MFGAYYFHQQGFAITAVTQRFIYFLLFYPLLHVLKPKPEELIRIVIYLGIIYAVIYLLQKMAYPMKLVDAKLFIDRATLRITIAGSGLLLIAYLVGLTKFIKTYDIRYFLLCLLSLVIFVLLGSRQVIAPAVLMAILSVIFSKKVKSRAVTILLMASVAIPVYFIFAEILGQMLTFSQHQAAYYKEDVRFKAAIYFLTDFFPNKLSYITGNGVPSALSPYGIQVNAFKKVLGFHQSDIGIIGDYSTFGILLVIAQIIIYVRAMSIRLPGELDFIKLNFLVLILTIFISGGAFSYAENIVIICLSLYLIDISHVYDKAEKGILTPVEKRIKPNPNP
jgi:hypothetical protein